MKEVKRRERGEVFQIAIWEAFKVEVKLWIRRKSSLGLKRKKWGVA